MLLMLGLHHSPNSKDREANTAGELFGDGPGITDAEPEEDSEDMRPLAGVLPPVLGQIAAGEGGGPWAPHR